MTVKGGSSPACASCKYQRRKCSSDCILAPYFPANQHKMFQNVHRLYGVSKIMNLLKEVSTNEQREDAMKSIKYESEMRARFPVHGCLTIIYQLRQHLQQALQELHYVHHQLSIYKDQLYTHQFTLNDNHCVDDEFAGDEHVNLMMMNTTPNHYSSEFDNNNNNNNNHNNSSMMIRTPSLHLEERDVSQGYEDFFFNPFADDTQSYCESSSESSLRDLNDKCVTKSDLKCAAASFGLISIE